MKLVEYKRSKLPKYVQLGLLTLSGAVVVPHTQAAEQEQRALSLVLPE